MCAVTLCAAAALRSHLETTPLLLLGCTERMSLKFLDNIFVVAGHVHFCYMFGRWKRAAWLWIKGWQLAFMNKHTRTVNREKQQEAAAKRSGPMRLAQF